MGRLGRVEGEEKKLTFRTLPGMLNTGDTVMKDLTTNT